MSTAVEIEAAIQKLPPDEFTKLMGWLEEYRAVIGATESLAVMIDEEERQSGRP